ncbi:MAG: hypothetical protein U0572_02390 [Phycisphaerales bacterium]
MLAAILLALTFLADPPQPTTPPAPTPPTAPPSADAIPSSIFLKEKPKDAKPVRDSKSAAKPGDKVTVVGRIGGRKEPFVKNRAVFLIVDPSLKSCADDGDDHCKTPWDYCCEPADNLKKCLATVQIADKAGKPFKVSADGAGGLKPLKKVTVVGVVRELSKDGAYVIDAQGIFVE